MKSLSIVRVLVATALFVFALLSSFNLASAATPPPGKYRIVAQTDKGYIVQPEKGARVADLTRAFGLLYQASAGAPLTWKVIQDAGQNSARTFPVCRKPVRGRDPRLGDKSIYQYCPDPKDQSIALMAGPAGQILIPFRQPEPPPPIPKVTSPTLETYLVTVDQEEYLLGKEAIAKYQQGLAHQLELERDRIYAEWRILALKWSNRELTNRPSWAPFLIVGVICLALGLSLREFFTKPAPVDLQSEEPRRTLGQEMAGLPGVTIQGDVHISRVNNQTNNVVVIGQASQSEVVRDEGRAHLTTAETVLAPPRLISDPPASRRGGISAEAHRKALRDLDAAVEARDAFHRNYDLALGLLKALTDALQAFVEEPTAESTEQLIAAFAAAKGDPARLRLAFAAWQPTPSLLPPALPSDQDGEATVVHEYSEVEKRAVFGELLPAEESVPDGSHVRTNGVNGVDQSSTPSPYSRTQLDEWFTFISTLTVDSAFAPLNLTELRLIRARNLFRVPSVVDPSVVADLGAAAVLHFATPRSFVDQLTELDRYGIASERSPLPPASLPPAAHPATT